MQISLPQALGRAWCIANGLSSQVMKSRVRALSGSLIWDLIIRRNVLQDALGQLLANTTWADINKMPDAFKHSALS